MGPHGRSKTKSLKIYFKSLFYTLDITIPSTLITFTDGKSIISDYVFNQTSKNSTPQ